MVYLSYHNRLHSQANYIFTFRDFFHNMPLTARPKNVHYKLLSSHDRELGKQYMFLDKHIVFYNASLKYAQVMLDVELTQITFTQLWLPL